MKTKKLKDDYVLVSSDGDYDDCPTCRALKEAERKGKNLSMAEIEEAFEKSKEVGGIVGRASEQEDQISN